MEIPEAPLHPEERHLDLSNLKIHEAPPYHGGAPLVPPHRGGDLLGLSTREGPEVALHLPKCFKPSIPRTPEATSRPTSIPSFARSTVPVKWRGVGYYKTNRFETAIKSEDAFTSGTDSNCTLNKQDGRGKELLHC